MTDPATPLDGASEVLQRLVAAHERMIALCEKVATAKAEAEPHLALEAIDRVESLARGVRLCLALDDRLKSSRATAAKARADEAAKALSAEKSRRRTYIRGALTPEHLRENDYEGNAHTDVDRILSRLDADGSLLEGEVLDALRRAAKFLGVPLPKTIEHDARELGRELAETTDPKALSPLRGEGLGVGVSALSPKARIPTPTPPRKGEGLELARASALADSS